MRLKLKQVFALLLCLMFVVLAACSAPAAPSESEPAVSESSAPAASQSAEAPGVQEIGLPAHTKQPDTVKYVFLFIGDGMGFAQVNAAQVFKASLAGKGPAIGSLSFTQFPVMGAATTFDETSVCPDSASSGTSIACGIKTKSGVIGMTGDKASSPESIAAMLKKDGKKIGVLSTVSLNNATPAAFYAHVPSRGDNYDIAVQLANSDMDYFGGGSLVEPAGSSGDEPNAFDMLEQNGYTVVDTKEEIAALHGGDTKAYAVNPALLQDKGSMLFAMDANEGDMALADFVRKGIDVLENENGFFMVCESGMIDWACHANDAASAIQETLVLEDAVSAAVDFAVLHPDETLIIVTADHETGGMAIGNAATGYNTDFSLLSGQTVSYSAFSRMFDEMKKADPDMLMSDVMPKIKECFGLIAPDDKDAALKENAARVLTAGEYKKLTQALQASLNGEAASSDDDSYGGYLPLTITLTHILNSKAGIGWTSFAHTGGLVPVYAYGVGADAFGGSYDNTDIFKKLVNVCGLSG